MAMIFSARARCFAFSRRGSSTSIVDLIHCSSRPICRTNSTTMPSSSRSFSAAAQNALSCCNVNSSASKPRSAMNSYQPPARSSSLRTTTFLSMRNWKITYGPAMGSTVSARNDAGSPVLNSQNAFKNALVSSIASACAGDASARDTSVARPAVRSTGEALATTACALFFKETSVTECSAEARTTTVAARAAAEVTLAGRVVTIARLVRAEMVAMVLGGARCGVH
mmetsp:Transcript_5210/g.19482  ORF Transcript_5210/g.19482 Transcript_5210/m.19482 type:complete len:225 (+) Transcript_5210:1892-2566(+)